MNTENALFIAQNKCKELPPWNVAKNHIRPYLISSEDASYALMIRNSDAFFSSYLTERIRMVMVLAYGDCIVPLREELLKKWDVNFAQTRIAMEDTMTKLVPQTNLEEHKKEGFVYFTVHHPQSILNSVIPFYKPFQHVLKKELGEPYYMAVPEQRTAVLFSKNYALQYEKVLRNDVLLTYECSSQYLSPELIEVSDAGVFAVMDN